MTRLYQEMKNKITVLFCFMASCFLCSAQLWASEDPFYFTAKSASMGASSVTGKGSTGVYLRWDIVEGKLPADIVRFELKRDGVLLLPKNSNESMDINALMPSEAVHKMYQGAAEQQRLLQTITLLEKLALAKKETFNAHDFPGELRKRFTNPADNAWVFLASRQNFNIARARYRAYLDTAATGTVTYTLDVFNAAGDVVQIGKVTLDTNKKSYQLLPVQGFEQLKKTQCDITEAMADHNTISLYWQPPGNDLATGKTANLTNKTASALQTVGYQIYRSTSNLAGNIIQAPIVDIAAKASTANHDQRGRLQLTGLERVNDLLVIAEGNIINNQRQAAYIETPRQLIAAGLKPGDKRAYYIVAVDFAGHLGKTVGTIVQVPNRQMPATPWNIRFSQAMGITPRASLEWDASTLKNYTAYYSFNRVICNAAEAAISNKIEYAANQQACDKPSTTRLDISHYLVYRFDSAQQAAGFADSDGDGYTNVDERREGSDSCNIDDKPATGAQSFLTRRIILNTPMVINLPGDRSIVRFTDSFLTQPENIGKTFWYRIASITADGNVSPLSATLPVVYWDNTLPPKPIVTAVTHCCEVKPLVPDPTKGGSFATGDWDFVDNVGLYTDISLATNNNLAAQTVPINISEFANSASNICSKSLTLFNFSGTKSNRVLTYPGAKAGVDNPFYCQAAIPDNMDICKVGGWQLTQSDCQQAVNNGDILDSDFTVTIEATEFNACVIYMKKITGEFTRGASSCGTNTPGSLVIQVSPGECGFAQQQNKNGSQSPIAEIPCTTAASSSPPGPPQIISFTAGESRSDFSWRLPLEPVAVTLIEISSDVDESVADPSDKQLISVANAGFNPGKVFDGYSTDIHTLLGERDQWCIRMKSIAPVKQDAAQVPSSEWSNRICNTRRSGSNVNTEYLPWPKLDVISMQTLRFPVMAAKGIVDAQRGMAYEKMPFVIPFALPTTELLKCVISGRTVNYEEPMAVNRGLLLFARSVECPTLNAVEKLQQGKMIDLPFIVYRQARTPEGVAGSWIQVSPLINKVYWEHQFVQGATTSRWAFKDPYFKFLRVSYENDNFWMLSYVDRYPHIAGYEYRYQIVSFNKDRAIQKIYLSAKQNDNWVGAAGLGASQ